MSELKPTDLAGTPDREQALLDQAAGKGPLGKALIYTLLSGPGWLQGAITLGGGSLAGALYLGVIMGYDMMWLQPMAMVLGVIMLSAISYVALSTGERPFETLKTHVSPVLAWAWLIATMMANIVWCLPQFALGTAAVEQNLVGGSAGLNGKAVIAGCLLVAATIVVWFYNSGSRGIKLFELILKGMVGVVVLSFFGVVLAMSASGALDWSQIAAGFIPQPQYLFKPVEGLAGSIAATGGNADWWTTRVAAIQKDQIITAFSTAVGINMTFLLPYSMLRKGWRKRQRGLAIFDLSIGLIVPFVLATSCVVIASASQFHARADDVIIAAQADGESKEAAAIKTFVGELAADGRVAAEEDRQMAAMLVGRDNFALANTLSPLVGESIAQKLFGVGVLGMALSTIIILMLINGFAFCELIGASPDGPMHRVGSFIPAVGVIGPFVWGAAAPALAVPTSVIGGAMLPIAYLSFLLLINSKSALGDAMPRGGKRLIGNLVMTVATLVAGFASIWGLSNKGWPGWIALGFLAVMLVVGCVGFASRKQ